MQKLIPHLWFDTQAKEAAEFYASLLPDSRVTSATTLHDTPGGDSQVVTFELAGQPFMAISAGPVFTFNPSISFMMNFDPARDPQAKEHLDKAWERLIDGGTALMPLQEYPFSKHYGWLQDKYGVSWQLMLTNPQGETRPMIIPALMFTQQVAGRAEAAIDFYTSVFKDGKRGTTARYPKGREPEKEGTIMFADFCIRTTWLAAMDSATTHKFTFNEAVSLVVMCETQEEIDYFWSKLSTVPESEQCGWCKDQFGVSWQIVPTEFGHMMQHGTPEQVARLTKTFLAMKKFDIAKLKDAFKE